MEEVNQKPFAWLVGFDERKQRSINIPLFWKTSRKTGNRFLKASKLEFIIPAGTTLHVFMADFDAKKEALDIQ